LPYWTWSLAGTLVAQLIVAAVAVMLLV